MRARSCESRRVMPPISAHKSCRNLHQLIRLDEQLHSCWIWKAVKGPNLAKQKQRESRGDGDCCSGDWGKVREQFHLLPTLKALSVQPDADKLGKHRPQTTHRKLPGHGQQDEHLSTALLLDHLLPHSDVGTIARIHLM